MSKTNTRTIAALTVVSVATLAYELTQIRVFAFSLHPVIAYSAIALAMLGFGLGATLLTLRPVKAETDRDRLLALLCMGLAGSMIAVNVLFARASVLTTPADTTEVDIFWAAVVLLPCIVPYLLSGMFVTLVFQAGAARIGRVYFWNLIGSAAGCTGMIILLRPLGAERLILIAAALAGVAGLIQVVTRPGALRWVAIAVAALSLLPMSAASRLFPFQPDVNGYNALFERWERLMGVPPPVTEKTEWDPIGRIDILRVAERYDYRVVTIDGGAMTLMLEDKKTKGWGKPLFADSLYAVAYHLRKTPDALVIGSGGGSDIQTALHWDARSVTGVEISGSTLGAVTGEYAEFVGWPARKNVTAHHGDGRAFAKSTDKRFDVIQMSGVDTMTMHPSGGAMVAAEDYLYTVEAFQDFSAILKPGGILSVMRFGKQSLKLSAIAVAALREMGIPDPEKCIVVLRQSHLTGVLIKLAPFDEEELAALDRFASRTKLTHISIPHYDFAGVQLSATVELLHPGGETGDGTHRAFFEAVAAGKTGQELAALGPEFVPPTDDRPYYILGEMFAERRRGDETHPALRLLIVSTAIIGLASLILILLPALFVRRRAGTGLSTLGAVLGYFFAIGAGFMLLEIGLIHRATIFVSTPGAAVAVVITAVLVSSGIGSRVSDLTGWPPRKQLLTAFVGLIAVSVIYRFGVGPLFDQLFGLPLVARCVAAALAIAPAGFFMGWFFPLGLKTVGARAPTLVPWGIAVNGFASVVGSLATLQLGVRFGFTGVFVIALLAYAAAFAILFIWTRIEGETL